MGNVYLAQDRNLADAPRAVKEMLIMFSDPSLLEKAIEDFRRESTLLAGLEHPSIPTIYDFFIDHERYYLVMKFIQGRDLSGQLNLFGGRIEEKMAVDWAIQTCDVLHYIHSLNPPIIFRDLKPANLMLDEKSNRIMLVDFGIARTVAPVQKGVTAIGTMGYAPPELFSGTVNARSDLYSLGATLFHLVTGADPQNNPLLIFDFTKNPRPTQINPKITPELERILMKATQHRPENRYGSALEMLHSLTEHMQRLGGKVVSPAGPPPPAPASDSTVLLGERPSKSVTRPTLVVFQSGEIANSYPIEKENMMIGRTDPNTGIFPEIDLTRYDPQAKVSRRHACLYRRGGQFLIEDIGSSNGTVINGTRLPPRQPRQLNNGDDLVFGDTLMKFKSG